MKTIASYKVLMDLQIKVGLLKKESPTDLEVIKKANEDLEAYLAFCLSADEMSTNCTVGFLDNL